MREEQPNRQAGLRTNGALSHPLAPAFPAVTVAVPGTCGELVQGWHPAWDEPVLVSCPITLYSQVRVWPCFSPDRSGPVVTTNGYAKSHRAAHLLLDHFHRSELSVQLDIHSQLLPGRGMASSTADIVGVLVGLAAALDRSLSPADLAHLACQVEPSDSIMFAGLTSLAYRGSARYEELGPAPDLPLLMLDTGEGVDTLTYNARLNLAAVKKLAPTTTVALEWLREGIEANNPAAIGAAATLSAISYQAISYNPLLLPAQEWARDTGALGLVRAHSGSVVGLLYDAPVDLAEPAHWLTRRFNGAMTLTHLTGGGSRLVTTAA